MGVKLDKALKITGVSKNQYYYKAKSEKPGRKPTKNVVKRRADGSQSLVSNDQIIDEIIETKLDHFLDYGYRAMCKSLQLQGYIINHKKVYRLMKEHHLLHDKTKKAKRNYVKFRSVYPNHPLECLEMDIKFQWVDEHQRYAFILTVIDCFTRQVLAWTVAYSIRQEQVKQVWNRIIKDYLQPNDMLKKQIRVELRNDNDSRFAAIKVQEYFAENHIIQVFTHPYTPQENGHVESFHAILGKSLKISFRTINDLENHLIKFYYSYNNIRLHGSLDHLSPSLFWKLWNQNLIEIIPIKGNKRRFKLNIPHHQLSGNVSLRNVSCLPVGHIKEVYGAISPQQPSVQSSPSVVSC